MHDDCILWALKFHIHVLHYVYIYMYIYNINLSNLDAILVYCMDPNHTG